MNHRKDLSNKGLAFSKTQILKVIAGILAIFAASQVAIPLQPVPMTLQAFAMLLIGLTYTQREAFSSIGLWLTLGALGLPVFANYSGGISVFLGPTGGYFIGLWLAPVMMAWIREKGEFQSILSFAVLAIFGQFVLFALGLTWLSQFVGWKQAVMLGFTPFLLWDLLKTALAVICARTFLLKKASFF